MSPGLAVSVEHPDYCPALLPYFITYFTTYYLTYYRYTVHAYLLHTSPILPWVYWTLRFDENYYSTKCAWAASLWAASYERWAPRRWWTAWRTLPLQCAGRAQLERCVVDFRGGGGGFFPCFVMCLMDHCATCLEC